jgi:uncharacterized protein YkuJ
MNEIGIAFNLQSPQEKNKDIKIYISEKKEDNLLYKFMIGCDGAWETLRDFSPEEEVIWTPHKDGRYTIMVQAKTLDSVKSFDYVSKADFIIGKEEEKIINNIYLDKEEIVKGDKVTLTIETKKLDLVFRYYIKEKDIWRLIKDYSAENTLTFIADKPGQNEILVQCKTLDSKNKFDECENILFQVEETKKVEIINFKCLIEDIIVDNELVFEVETSCKDGKTILYKFIKVAEDGSKECIQDYSNKNIVSFIETKKGDYKLLCLVKDIYSPRDYDDIAALNYTVKPYKDIVIQSFTSDLSSPQVCETCINFKAVVFGGKELQYRFKIDGNHPEDSGYIRNSNFLWKTKKPGKYKIELWVKDVSFDGNYEKSAVMNFIIEEKNLDPIIISKVVLDKNNKILIGETINAKVIASGGIEPRYSFHVKKEGKEIEKINFGTCNWVNFTPEEKGVYELEVRVKDKYSKRNYDSHSIVYIEAFDYMPASIDYILHKKKENYQIGDIIDYEIITQYTQKTLVKYVLNINGRKVEETDYVKDKNYSFIPKCSGIYTLEIYAKNEKSDKEFDCKREIKINVYDAPPISNIKISCDKKFLKVNETVTFNVSCDGGQDVLYKFYIMEQKNWKLVQNYSKKNYYSFMPFHNGVYKLLVLCKSGLRKCDYEDYDIIKFQVE